jgi:hypothetical protein
VSPHEIDALYTFLSHPGIGRIHRVDPAADWSKQPDQELQLQELSDYYERCIDEPLEEYRMA